jgi:5-formyltetrahydrofolate cyclo-ligase
MNEKTFLRKKSQQRLRSISDGEFAEKSQRICVHLEKIIYEKHPRVVAGYFPFQREVNILPALEKFLYENVSVAFPRIMDNDMQFFAVHSLDIKNGEFDQNSFGIWQPKKTAQTIDAKDISIALVPGLAFDKKLYRLGRGMGFYDKFLCSVRPNLQKIGICFAQQIVDFLPTEKHDVPMTNLLTEENYFD